jgi:hypothetical protein
MSRNFWITFGLLCVLLNGGCGGTTDPSDDADVDDGTDADGDEDTDGDGDSDSDGDSDGDGDEDTDSARPVGAACERPDDCDPGAFGAECLGYWGDRHYPEGYCAPSCWDDEDCPGDSGEAVCVRQFQPDPAPPGYCLAICSRERPCREDYSCFSLFMPYDPALVCVPACSTDEDCPGEAECDRYESPGMIPRCFSAEGSPNGAACTSHAECRQWSSCFQESADPGYPGGLCTQSCNDDEGCTNGGVCAAHRCLEPCDPAGEAACPREGYTCQPANAAGDRHVCAPDCGETPNPCTIDGFACDPSVVIGGFVGRGLCQRPIDEEQLGGPCSISSGCTGGHCLTEAFDGFPHGLCTEECDPESDPCPAGSVCIVSPGWMNLCEPDCSVGSCRPGYQCADEGEHRICKPACTANDQCRFGCCLAEGSCDGSRGGPCS